MLYVGPFMATPIAFERYPMMNCQSRTMQPSSSTSRNFQARSPSTTSLVAFTHLPLEGDDAGQLPRSVGNPKPVARATHVFLVGPADTFLQGVKALNMHGIHEVVAVGPPEAFDGGTPRLGVGLIPDGGRSVRRSVAR